MKPPLADLPDSLEAVIEKFWADNPELKRQVLREWYCGGRVTHVTNKDGMVAVDKWLAQAKPTPMPDDLVVVMNLDSDEAGDYRVVRYDDAINSPSWKICPEISPGDLD
jgi:hypothetical protein